MSAIRTGGSAIDDAYDAREQHQHTSAICLLRLALAARGAERDRLLLHAFLAIAVAVGIEAFATVMRGAADRLLSANAPEQPH